MKKKYLKKALAGLLAAGMVISMAGCGGSNESGSGDSTKEEAAVDAAGSEEPVT